MDDINDIQEAVQLFLLENLLVEPELAYAIVQFNWDRGVRDLEDLICVEPFANVHSEAN